MGTMNENILNSTVYIIIINIRLGRFGTPCIIQLFLGTPLIDIHEKLHSSSQNSKTRAGAGLDDINMDQSETRHIRSGF